MKSLVIYDSTHSNTQKIAKIIADILKTKALPVSQASLSEIRHLDLLLVGSPTQGGQATKNLQDFLKTIPPSLLSGTKIATFDTRFEESIQKLPLRLLMKTIGYAAPKINQKLISKGGLPVVEPCGFIVQNTKGPLKAGELDRARNWALKLIKL